MKSAIATPVRRRRRQQLGFLPAAAAAASTAITGAGSAGTAAAVSAWVPIVGPAIAAVTLGISFLMNRKRPKQKQATTNIANDVEAQLKANLAAYLDSARTPTNQAAALGNFDSLWGYLTSSQGCGNVEMGEPGRNCISERDRGGRWDWFALYRDPIAQDPDVRDGNPLADAVTGLMPGTSPELASQIGGKLLPAALILFALVVL